VINQGRGFGERVQSSKFKVQGFGLKVGGRGMAVIRYSLCVIRGEGTGDGRGEIRNQNRGRGETGKGDATPLLSLCIPGQHRSWNAHPQQLRIFTHMSKIESILTG
jgi:hypothetical protein